MSLHSLAGFREELAKFRSPVRDQFVRVAKGSNYLGDQELGCSAGVDLLHWLHYRILAVDIDGHDHGLVRRITLLHAGQYLVV